LFLPTQQVMMEIDFNDPASLMPLVGGRATTLELLEQAANNPPDFIADYGALPPYRLAALADRQEGEWQVAMIALAYNSVEDAEIGAPELAQRIESFSNIIFLRRREPIFDEFPSATIESRVYTSPETGLYAAVVELRYPTPSQEEEQAPPDISYAGVPREAAAFYQFLVNPVFRRVFYPLWLVANMPE
jgi:hypothetical protein